MSREAAPKPSFKSIDQGSARETLGACFLMIGAYLEVASARI